MKRTYCDRCKKEIEERAYSFEPLLHICEMGEGRPGGYIDLNTQHMTSGRTVHYDLCLPCYNRVYMAAYRELKNIESTESA